MCKNTHYSLLLHYTPLCSNKSNQCIIMMYGRWMNYESWIINYNWCVCAVAECVFLPQYLQDTDSPTCECPPPCQATNTCWSWRCGCFLHSTMSTKMTGMKLLKDGVCLFCTRHNFGQELCPVSLAGVVQVSLWCFSHNIRFIGSCTLVDDCFF